MNIEETLIVIRGVNEILESAEYFKAHPNKKPPKDERYRKIIEERYTKPRIEWKEGHKQYSAEFICKCTENHLYHVGIYKRNGRQTTITAIRNSIERLKINVDF